MKLNCDVLIQNLNQKENIEKVYKESTLALCRLSTDNTKSSIVLTINTKTSLKFQYKLNKIELYTKYIKDGKSTINMVNEKILILISNTPSQNLINFLSFLKIKIKNRTTPKPLKSHLNNFLNKENLKNISPLTNMEIDGLIKPKQAGNTPVRPPPPQHPTQSTRPLLKDLTNTQAESKRRLFNNSPKKPSIYKLTNEQICTLKAIKEGKQI
jgi:hypothetical protein